MSLEPCKLCNQESTPWIHINGHICEDCYANTKRLFTKTDKLSWISCNDKLPKNDKEVLIFWEECITTGYNAGEDGNQYWIDSERGCDLPVTHWMPFPEPPIK